MKFYTKEQTIDYYKPLLGRRVVKYNVNSDNDQLILVFDDGSTETLQVEGDCLACSWIESLDSPDNLLGVITHVEDIEMPNLGDIGTDKHRNVKCVDYYGLKITTDKGSCVLDYRNDSNGYYGGTIYLVSREV